MSPHCQSNSIKKDGLYRSYQKSIFVSNVKEKRIHNDKTGTIFHYSHTPLKIWFLAMYLYFVLWPGCSIREEISLEIVVPYPRCYRQIYQTEQLWKKKFLLLLLHHLLTLNSMVRSRVMNSISRQDSKR